MTLVYPVPNSSRKQPSMSTHENGMADKLLDQARDRLAKGRATDTDRLMIVIEAMSARNLHATTNREEFTVKLFGRSWTATEMVFGFGFLVAIETGYVIVDLLPFV